LLDAEIVDYKLNVDGGEEKRRIKDDGE